MQHGSFWHSVFRESLAWTRLVRMGRGLFLGMLGAIALGLTGCIDSDLQIHYHTAHRGEIVQQLQLGKPLKQLNAAEVATWFQAIDRRATSLGGKTTTADTLTIALPFYNSADLETKFNQLLAAILTANAPTATRPPQLASHLTVTNTNFLVIERHQLHYELDLRSLGVAAATGDILVSPTGLIHLNLTLETPWGAQNQAIAPNAPAPTGDRRHLTWPLLPGELNQIDCVFWVPNRLGLGTVLILLLVSGGIALKPLSQNFRQ